MAANLASLLMCLRPHIAILLIVGHCRAQLIMCQATTQHQQNNNAVPDLLKIIWRGSKPFAVTQNNLVYYYYYKMCVWRDTDHLQTHS